MLIDYLTGNWELIVRHPLDCLPALNTVDGIIIRNIWPTHEYGEDWEDVKSCIRRSELPVYNPLTFKGDIEGKNYLVELSRDGYPVIPSVENIRELAKLPSSAHYWIKPKRSCDGFGAAKLTIDELIRERPTDHIIQPFVEFEYEPSFFLIDNKFHHAFWERHRLHDDRVFSYVPTKEDLEFVRRFVEWADMPYGIQRIDAIRTREGNLLLTEVENLCPYLYLRENGERTRRSFMEAIRQSILNVFPVRSRGEGSALEVIHI